MARTCKIDYAYYEEIGRGGKELGGDGIYEINGVSGSPEKIGKLIEEALRTGDLWAGQERPSVIDAGGRLKYTLSIIVKRKPR